jgi:hypothetical protein
VCAVGSAAGAGKDSDTALISGTATAADQRPLINYLVRLRSLDTARIVATTRTTTTGEYAFPQVNAGRYGVEILDAASKIVGTAGPFIVSTAGHPTVKSITIVGATAAAIASALATTSSHGSARDVAAAADSAGITGNGVSGSRILPSRPQ